MCGIAGFISNDPEFLIEDRDHRLGLMCSRIVHRGPDEEGRFLSGPAALGMRRLSIIDLSTGQQPIYSEDKNLVIVFNGEIYNFQDLKRELESLGHRFRTNSDTETIVHAYEEFGPGCVEKLRGMFAFAIWNIKEQSLFLARDRVGKKPLFYCRSTKGDFVFGSEVKAVFAHGGIEKQLDLRGFDAYITFGYVPEELCIYKDVHKLAPGNWLLFKDGQIQTNKYWDFDYRNHANVTTESEFVERLREKLLDSVKVRLISEVPLGAFLSGGVDSSTIVALMSQLSESSVKTFSIGFNEDSFNELKYARIAAKHFGTEHHEFIVTPDLVETVDELVSCFDEPFADSSALPTFMLSKMAREFVTVALSGDGGDELFGGYTRYVDDAKNRRFEYLPKGVQRGLNRLSESLPHGAKGKNFLYNISLNPIDRYLDSVSQFNEPRKEYLYSADFRSKLNGSYGAGSEIYRQFANSVSTGNPADNLMYLDSKTYLPSDILTKVDRMSMANSLEVRAPLLDHELIEFVLTVPSEMKLKVTETKYILKKAMAKTVPDEILYRPKQGFGVPIKDWINRELRSRIRDTLLEPSTMQRGYFNKNYIQTLFNEHSVGRRDHSHALWVLFMLELWHRKCFD